MPSRPRSRRRSRRTRTPARGSGRAARPRRSKRSTPTASRSPSESSSPVTLTTIVAGVDLSVPSEQALDRAAALAQLNNATLVMVNAQADDAPIENIDNEVLRQPGEVSAAVRVEEAKRLAERHAGLTARGIHVELVHRAGPPGEVVAEVAKERAAELI